MGEILYIFWPDVLLNTCYFDWGAFLNPAKVFWQLYWHQIISAAGERSHVWQVPKNWSSGGPLGIFRIHCGACVVAGPIFNITLRKDHWTLKTGYFEDRTPSIQVQTLPLEGPRSLGYFENRIMLIWLVLKTVDVFDGSPIPNPPGMASTIFHP